MTIGEFLAERGVELGISQVIKDLSLNDPIAQPTVAIVNAAQNLLDQIDCNPELKETLTGNIWDAVADSIFNMEIKHFPFRIGQIRQSDNGNVWKLMSHDEKTKRVGVTRISNGSNYKPWDADDIYYWTESQWTMMKLREFKNVH